MSRHSDVRTALVNIIKIAQREDGDDPIVNYDDMSEEDQQKADEITDAVIDLFDALK